MTKTQRIGLWIAGSIVGLLAVLFVVAIIIAQSDWFHNYVREKIVSVTEESTGGEVDLASFDFDWTHLRATLTDFVIHGTEPAGAAPLLYAKTVTVELKLLASLKQYVDIRSLTVDTPKVNVIVYPDGTTNVPAPKVKKPSDKSGLETVVDLAIGKFDLHNGYLVFAQQKIPINAQGENLRAQLDYNVVTRGYQGTLNNSPLLFAYAGKPPLKIVVSIPIVLQRDTIQVSDAKIYTPESQLVVNASMTDMKAPKTNVRVNDRLALAELKRVTGIKIPPQAGQRLPGVVNTDLNITMDPNRIELSSARLTLGG